MQSACRLCGAVLGVLPVGSDRSASLRVGLPMDRQSKREIWLLAIGTIIFEVPVVAIAALAILAR